MTNGEQIMTSTSHSTDSTDARRGAKAAARSRARQKTHPGSFAPDVT